MRCQYPTIWGKFTPTSGSELERRWVVSKVWRLRAVAGAAGPYLQYTPGSLFCCLREKGRGGSPLYLVSCPHSCGEAHVRSTVCRKPLSEEALPRQAVLLRPIVLAAGDCEPGFQAIANGAKTRSIAKGTIVAERRSLV